MGCLWANRAHRVAVVAAVADKVVVGADEVQAASVAAAAALQRTQPIVAAGALVVGFRTVAVARKGQEYAVAVGAGYAVTVNAVKGGPSPSAAVA